MSRKRPSNPSVAKRSCQRHTQVFDLPVCHMISTVPTPSALSRMISAHQTCFCGALRIGRRNGEGYSCAHAPHSHTHSPKKNTDSYVKAETTSGTADGNLVDGAEGADGTGVWGRESPLAAL